MKNKAQGGEGGSGSYTFWFKIYFLNNAEETFGYKYI